MRDNFFMELFGGALRCLQKHWHVPLPERWKVTAGEYGADTEAAMLVFSGWCAALIIISAGAAVRCFFNNFAGALIFAVAAWLVMLFYDRGRGDGLIAAQIAGNLPADNIPLPVVLPMVLMIMKCALLMGLFYWGGAASLLVIFAGSMALEVLLLMEADFVPPVIADSGESRRRFQVVVVILLLISFFAAKLPVALGALIFALLWRFLIIRIRQDGMTASEIRYWSALCAWFMLLAGVFAI